MADFTRLALFVIAENAGWERSKPITRPVRIALRSALLKHLRTPEGKQALADVPRQLVAERGEAKHRQMDENDAVNALIEELAT